MSATELKAIADQPVKPSTTQTPEPMAEKALTAPAPAPKPASTPIKVAVKRVAKPAAKKIPVAKPPAVKAEPAPIVKKTRTSPLKTFIAPAQPKVIQAKSPSVEKSTKVKKPKLVRDSFTIPKAEYMVLDELKQRAIKLAQPAKKSELLRAGIKALAAMSDTAFAAAMKAVPTIKTGRPAKP